MGLEAGRLRVRVSGDPGPEYRLEGTTEFGRWQVLESVRPAAVPFDWLVTVDSGASAWFFRVGLGP